MELALSLENASSSELMLKKELINLQLKLGNM